MIGRIGAVCVLLDRDQLVETTRRHQSSSPLGTSSWLLLVVGWLQ